MRENYMTGKVNYFVFEKCVHVTLYLGEITLPVAVDTFGMLNLNLAHVSLKHTRIYFISEYILC